MGVLSSSAPTDYFLLIWPFSACHMPEGLYTNSHDSLCCEKLMSAGPLAGLVWSQCKASRGWNAVGTCT